MPNSRKQHCDSSDCPLAHTLDIVGDKWTLIIIRDMAVCNKHEYKEFMESPEGISTNILADRLKKLEHEKIIKSIPHPQYKTRKLYYLTAAGKEFIHVLSALVKWGGEHLDGVTRQSDEDDGNCVVELFENLASWEKEYLGEIIQ
ncbi:MAG: winged helix-turn-helix transcriptional regulator [Alphaproteobacteria bacterium]